MHRRHFYVVFLFLYAELGLANNKTGAEEVVQGASEPIAVDTGFEWDCESNEQNGSWNCNPARGYSGRGAGITEESEETEKNFGIFTAAFNKKQERIFDTLELQLKQNPWESCTSSSSKSDNQFIANNDLRNDAPMDVTADYSEVFNKEISDFFGNVEILRADQHMLADTASYNTVSEIMDAQGNVFYSENEISLYSNTAQLNLNTDEARLREALFISPSGPIRGSAEALYRDNKFLSRYGNVAFTSCRPGNQDWVVHAQRLKMNRRTGKAAAKNAWLEFKGVPILYTPYILFPLDDRRMSGFLLPTFGANDENGFDFVMPYYWNIAPNYDLTVWPRYMSRRGGMLGGEFRYLTKMAEGQLGLEYLPYDTLRKEGRFSATFKNTMRITDDINSNVDLNYVSDKEYLDELSNTLGLSNDRHLRSQADINYNIDGISFSTLFEAYQTIDKDITDLAKPYQKLPQVTFNLDHSFDQWPIDLAMENEYVHFYRDGRVSGHRFNTKPSISIPLETAGAFFKPQFSLQHTLYKLYERGELDERSAEKSDNISRTVPIVSVDSGLIFEKNFEFLDSKFMHTIEPRLFYLYIPERDQDDIHVFDSSLYDFNYNSLFRENRFSSVDRVQDANQITVAMTTRLIDSDTGREQLSLSVGEIFYFKDRKVTLSGQPETNSLSNLVAELNGRLTDELSFSSGIQWNPNVNDFTRGQAELKYRGQTGKIINIGYRYRRDDPTKVADIIQTDASFRWPLYDNWYGIGRWQYSLQFNSTKESFIGLEKESCCWRFRFIWRKYANTITGFDHDETDQGIFLQLELKGLTSFGDKVDDFLEENLKGYQRVK